jgi:hypothetical protein
MLESIEEKLIRYEREAETMPDSIKPVVKRLLRGIRDSLAAELEVERKARGTLH